MNNTVKTLATTLTVVSCSMTCSAVTLLFDIGPLGFLDGGGGLSQTTLGGDVWNNFGQVSGNTDHGGVQDSAGNETTFTLAASGVTNRDGNTTLNASWGGTAPQTVMNSWYFRTGNGAITMTFKGATANSLWDIEVLNSFDTGGTSDIQVNGLFANGSAAPTTAANGDGWERQVNGFNNDTGLVFNSVAADASGNFTVTVNANNSTIQGLSFTSVPVPEPSSTALLGLGGLALMLRRRK